MLTATYSIVAISAEQKNSRSILFRLQQYLHNCLEKFNGRDHGAIAAALEKLAQFDQRWHMRKMELYVIPAIRGATHEVDCLLEELELMSSRGLAILRSAQEKMRRALDQGLDYVKDVYRSLEGYCENLSQRLAKEENELLPMVGRLLTSEQWFPIAAQLLSDDAHGSKLRHQRARMSAGANRQYS